MIDLAKISALERDEDGLWVACRDEAGRSFTESGNLRRQEFEASSFWYRHRSAVLCELLERFPPAGTLLDIGGGNGTLALALEAAGWEAVVLEPDRSGALFARRRGLRQVACASLEAAEFQPAVFDAVGLFDVLEHIEDEAGFLKHAVSLLRPAGRLYLTVPAYSELWSAADHRAGHLRRYRRAQLEGVVRAAGLGPLFSSYLFASLVAPVWLLRHLPYRFGRRRTLQEADGRRHHRAGNRLTDSLLRRLLELERRAVRRGKRIPFGTSCVMVAAKPGGA